MPAAWDRLADATQPQRIAETLSIVTLAHVHTEDLEPLATRFTKLEQLVLDIAPRDDLAKHHAELNRAVDAASADWILIVREREQVSEALADEIARAILDAKARGFRIRTTPIYAGQPLRIGHDDGELRLFHRRYFLRRGEMSVQGTVVRLHNDLRSITFESAEAHRQYLEKNGVPHSTLRRLLLFAHHVVTTRATDRNTLQYLWIEAGFDHAISGTTAR